MHNWTTSMIHAARARSITPRMSALAALAIAGLALLGLPTTASPAGQIVIDGADSASHLRLTMSGDNILVNGYMAPGDQAGCRVTRARTDAVCPAGGVDSIQIVMGPGGDKVEVLDPLPLPVTAYLGNGSDKFIGNSEQDTCYPQGARRNRCIGGAGDDVCITGPRNSDCVGGPGNDFCKHSTGSDGCWGGPGNDLCEMGPGKDGCHGGPGDDRLYEGPGTGKLYGGPGFDYCDGGPGVGRSYTCEAGPGH
jgi:Ca2+-binding RTX toxin-like protein